MKKTTRKSKILNVRLSERLHRRLKEYAKEREFTMSELITLLIVQEIGP